MKRPLLSCLAVCVACSSSEPDAPRIDAVTPATLVDNLETEVEVRGVFYAARFVVDFGDEQRTSAERRLRVLLDQISLEWQAVDATRFIASVPAGLPVKSYDLTVIDALERSVTLTDALTVSRGPCGAHAPVEAACAADCALDPGCACAGATCQSACGDGVVRDLEACDDGNPRDNDGCTSTCEVDAGFACFGSPSLCALEERVAFVDAAAACPGEGSRSRPFCELETAVEAEAPVLILASGTHRGGLVITEREVVVAGPPSAIIQGGVDVRDQGRLTLVGVSVTSDGDGIRVDGEGSEATIHSVHIQDTGRVGVRATNSARLTLNRSSITRCAEGGLVVDQVVEYAVTNNIIAENGNDGSIGGVLLGRSRGRRQFANNSVIDNRARSVPAAVICDEPGLDIENSILWGNKGVAVVNANCALSYCDVSDASLALGTNFSAEPRLTFSHKLSSNSPCIDAGDPAGTTPLGPAPARDYDGQVRPLGARVDVGADELR